MDELKKNDNEIRRRVIEAIIDFFDDARNKGYSPGDLENGIEEILKGNIAYADMCKDCFYKESLEQIGDRLGSRINIKRDALAVIGLLNEHGCYHSEDLRKRCQRKVGLVTLAEWKIRRERAEVPQDQLIEQAQLLQSTGELHRRLVAFEKNTRQGLGLLCGIVNKMCTYSPADPHSEKVSREEINFMKQHFEGATERVSETHGDECRCDACTTDKLYEDPLAGKLRAGPPCPSCKTPMGRTSNKPIDAVLYGQVMCDRCSSTFIICPKCDWFMVETLGPLSVRHFHCKRCDSAVKSSDPVTDKE